MLEKIKETVLVNKPTSIEDFGNCITKEGFLFDPIKSAMSNDIFYKITDKILVDLKFNVKVCPINDVPVIVTLKKINMSILIRISLTDNNYNFKLIEV